MQREIFIILPGDSRIDIIETIDKNNDRTGNIHHVDNIYRYCFTTFNFKTALDISAVIAKNYLNRLIDKM